MNDIVHIEIPAATKYVAFARVSVASLVVDLDPDVDEVDDLRVAVDELVGLLMDAADGAGTVQLQMAVAGDVIEVAGRASDVPGLPEPDDLTRRILEATADAWEVGPGTFSLRKRIGRG